MTVPEGFEPHFRKSRVTDPWEPLYSRTVGDAVELGLVIAEAHCNGRGFLHGGVIATLADSAMGWSYVHIARRRGADANAITVSLVVDFLSMGRLGQWLQISPRVVRAGRTLGFVDALVTADGTPIARANATFQQVKGD